MRLVWSTLRRPPGLDKEKRRDTLRGRRVARNTLDRDKVSAATPAALTEGPYVWWIQYASACC